MSKQSPTSRSLEALAASGWTAQKVEYWLSFGGKGGIRKDLFGGIDIVAVRPGEVLGVQATSKSNVSARVKKLLGLPAIKAWVESGAKMEVWGWDGNDLRAVEIKAKDFSHN
jgi:hypothetical protein